MKLPLKGLLTFTDGQPNRPMDQADFTFYKMYVCDKGHTHIPGPDTKIVECPLEKTS